mmetsp:Transcript_1731/g.2824  ORF Transcript_1731/g.2824 Transcript_1731/m.2824 type:complete len:427 (+) Transcript_1731:140-1420(+)
MPPRDWGGSAAPLNVRYHVGKASSFVHELCGFCAVCAVLLLCWKFCILLYIACQGAADGVLVQEVLVLNERERCSLGCLRGIVSIHGHSREHVILGGKRSEISSSIQQAVSSRGLNPGLGELWCRLDCLWLLLKYGVERLVQSLEDAGLEGAGQLGLLNRRLESHERVLLDLRLCSRGFVLLGLNEALLGPVLPEVVSHVLRGAKALGVAPRLLHARLRVSPDSIRMVHVPGRNLLRGGSPPEPLKLQAPPVIERAPESCSFPIGGPLSRAILIFLIIYSFRTALQLPVLLHSSHCLLRETDPLCLAGLGAGKRANGKLGRSYYVVEVGGSSLLVRQLVCQGSEVELLVHTSFVLHLNQRLARSPAHLLHRVEKLHNSTLKMKRRKNPKSNSEKSPLFLSSSFYLIFHTPLWPCMCRKIYTGEEKK